MNPPTDTTEREAPGLAIRVSQLSREVGHLREVVRRHGFEIRAFHGRFEAGKYIPTATILCCANILTFLISGDTSRCSGHRALNRSP